MAHAIEQDTTELEGPEAEMVSEGCPHATPRATSTHISRDATGGQAVRMSASRQLANSAEAIANVSKRLNGLLSNERTRRALRALPGPTSAFMTRLARVLVSSSRLGCMAHGGNVARSLAAIRTVTGSNSLSSHVAALALRLRIEAMAEAHPELLEDSEVHSIIVALSDGRQLDALRIYRRMKSERGNSQVMADFAPIFTELTGLLALLDNNPFNDAVAWSLVTSTAPRGEPLLGVSAEWVAGLESGAGSAVKVEPSAEVASRLNADFGVESHMRNIGALRAEGYVLVQRIDCHDGQDRYIVDLPGMTADEVSGESTQDLVGAIRNVQHSDSTYTRALKQFVIAHAVPEGSEIAFIGHSQGGSVAMNMGEDEDFNKKYTITHIVAIGSPVDHKNPLESIWCASVTNQHDIVPSLDGRGPGSPHNPHPEWFEVDYSDPSHGFPACHHAMKYAENLAHDIPQAAAEIDARMERYRGRVAETSLWLLKD
ncbi:lipase family protein [Haloglycomyces albus]|uniref:lipase family protein n=1 Tax=Haloglycomyces albus TaxID=526067 RepID=UPI00046D6FE8|nr:lipase family protein [Haloglycomyces albus]